MDQQKSRVKKFLTLIKGAQNSAFVGLVCDNLRVELQQKPWKIIKMVDFVLNEIPRANSDFTRLKLINGLIPLFAELNSIETFQKIITKAQENDKWKKKLYESGLVIDLEETSENERAIFTFTDLITRYKGAPNFYADILENYQPLLAEGSLNENSSASSNGGAQNTKESMKQLFMENALGLGAGRVNDKLKLSDFIDENFFDDVQGASDMEMPFSAKKQQNQGSLKELLRDVKKSPICEVLMQAPKKRAKGGAAEVQTQYIFMNPVVALIVSILRRECLVDSDWKVRQASFATVREALKHNLEYFFVKADHSLTSISKLPLSTLANALLPYAFLVIVKDHFNDFEELRVLTPVREEALSLLIDVIELTEESQAVLAQLPQLLKTIETKSSDSWITRYNFFMLVKGWFSGDKIDRLQRVFDMFNRVLLESLVHLEDQVRIIVTEIITMILPLHQQQQEYLENMSKLLKNLMKNLKKSDEIESSAIPVFTLINKILDSMTPERLSTGRFNFKFNLKINCPFNFHQIANVRYSYLQILNKAIQFGTAFSHEELQILIKLTLQSLAMERTKPIVKLNMENLSIICNRLVSMEGGIETLVNFIDIAFSHDLILPTLLYNYQMGPTFDNFIFYESKNFESIERDYFRIVFRPVSQEELAKFYQGKAKNMTKAFSILMQSSPDVTVHMLKHMEGYMLPPQTLAAGLQPPVHEAHLLYLMVLCNLLASKNSQRDSIDPQYANNIASNFLLPSFAEESISIFHFKDIQRLQQLTVRLYELLTSSQACEHILQAYSYLYQQLEACYYQHNLSALRVIMNHLETELSPLFTEANAISECFEELRGLIEQLGEYGSITTTRIRQLSAYLHILLVDAYPGSITLTGSLNNLIKPLLNQVKKETNPYLQKLASRASVKLLSTLFTQGKVKPANQILQLIIKDIEILANTKSVFTQQVEGAQRNIAEDGVRQVIREIVKSQVDVFAAFNGYFIGYLAQQATNDSYLSLCRVAKFLLEVVFERQQTIASDLFASHQNILTELTCTLINQKANAPEIPILSLLHYRLFPQSRQALLNALLCSMQAHNRTGFETLVRLLDDFQGGNIPDFVAYLPAFVIPVIQGIQISRQIFEGDDKQVTLILAQLLSLLPLNLATLHTTSAEESKQDDPLQLQVKQGFQFLQVFVNNQSGSEEYKLSIKVKANLRDYQRQGITWLASLGKYNLNCALCDDMGLGKTLQALCVILNESYLKLQQSKKRMCNLIVCPTTITYNWKQEISKYFDGIKVAVFEGVASDKQNIIDQAKQHKLDVIIVSYEKLRNDLALFQEVKFFYIALDEGHIIKNPKAKTTKAVKSLICEKKLVLTGTPLQNKVAELWSIFDFLMPGFLEEENVFNKKYNQYLTSNIKRLSEKLEETQAFIGALKSLKKRIQPFILRRTKDEVLKELPPKVIMDVPCKMPSFQEHVHTLLEKAHPIIASLQQAKQSTEGKAKESHLKNVLRHRRVCNHPYYIAQDFLKDPSVAKYLHGKSEQELQKYESSGKLLGLVEKLTECEIIKEGEEIDTNGEVGLNIGDIVEQRPQKCHRALIFCQMKSFLRMIVEQVLIKFKVPYMELDSGLSSKERMDIVERFNNDESIKVLILTTKVGGLGLTLTGADIVIFAEHDWNPMSDLQAIDRAHRIGQTRQVFVYRLITQDTLEEKIMNLQRFKENLAKSLVQSRDASIENAQSMEITDLLNSFQEHSAFAEGGAGQKKGAAVYEDKLVSGIDQMWQGGAFSVEDL